MGFKTRIDILRDKKDRTKIVGQKGGNPLSLKLFWYCVENPIYAAINPEKWTQGKPVKCKFDGLVSIELFNKANRGKIVITEHNGEITIGKRKPPEYIINKGVRTPDFPYKRHVMCPQCERPLYGSASRGKLGKYYAAYHCNRSHYFRVPRKEFNEKVADFVKSIRISPEYVEALTKAVITEWERREIEQHKDEENIDVRIATLKREGEAAINKIKYLDSEIAIKHMERELIKTEEQIAALTTQKQQVIEEKPTDMKTVMQYVKYFLEHLELLLLQQINPVAQAGYFGVLFDKAPTYNEITLGTPKIAAAIELNRLFCMKHMNDDDLADYVAQDWNTVWPSLLSMYHKLAELEGTGEASL